MRICRQFLCKDSISMINFEAWISCWINNTYDHVFRESQMGIDYPGIRFSIMPEYDVNRFFPPLPMTKHLAHSCNVCQLPAERFWMYLT
jgi:hypothetical protein